MKKATTLKLEKQTIAIIKSKNTSSQNLFTTKAETSLGDILQSLVEICTSLTK